MSPSQLALGRECNVTQVLRALEPVDMTDYPVVAVLDVKMPLLPEQANPSVLESVVRCFVDYGGSVLQINVVDPSALADARADGTIRDVDPLYTLVAIISLDLFYFLGEPLVSIIHPAVDPAKFEEHRVEHVIDLLMNGLRKQAE